MKIVELMKQMFANYLGNGVNKAKIPDFEEEEERRYKIIFSGVVQGVGFRYEVWLLAEKIGVTGFAENLPNGNVLVEAQGPKNKLLYLIEYMRKIPRIYIDDIEIDEIEMKDEEHFVPIY